MSTGAVKKGPPDRLDPARRRAGVRVEPRGELTGPLPTEEPEGEPEEMTEEIGLQGRRGTHTDPEREQVVAEIDEPLQEARRQVREAQQEDRAEPILHRGA